MDEESEDRGVREGRREGGGGGGGAASGCSSFPISRFQRQHESGGWCRWNECEATFSFLLVQKTLFFFF